MSNLTDWFSHTTPPARVGVYEVKASNMTSLTWYAHWNGKRFGYRARTPELASDARNEITMAPAKVMWRGLASDPSLQKQEQ